MWKIHNGRLIQTADESRMRYKTRISAVIVEQLKQMAQDHDTHISYLLENGYSNLLEAGVITFNKKIDQKIASSFVQPAIKSFCNA